MNGTYELTYDPQGIILVTIQGEVTLETAHTLIPLVLDLAQEHACFRVLVDLRNTQPKFTMADLYALPDLLAQLGNKFGVPAHTFKRALLTPQLKGLPHFFETTSRNRGQNVRLFQDAETARHWLLGE